MLNIQGGSGGQASEPSKSGVSRAGCGIYILDNLAHQVSLTNTIEGEPIAYMYNGLAPNAELQNLTLTAPVCPTNLGKLVVISGVGVVVKDNVVSNFTAPLETSGSGIYMSNTVDPEVSGNTINNITGGTVPLPKKWARNKGMPSAGIWLRNVTGGSVSDNVISDIDGGRGSPTQGDAASGGIAMGIRMTSTSSVELKSNTISDLEIGLNSDGEALGPPGVGFWIDANAQNNTIADSNTVDGDKVLYYYGETDPLEIAGYELTAPSSATNLGEIVVLESSGVMIRNNTIAGVHATQIGTLDYTANGRDAVGIRVKGCADCTVRDNVVSAVIGGHGSTPASTSYSAGSGGRGVGIWLENMTGGQVIDNRIFDIEGGETFVNFNAGTPGESMGIRLAGADNLVVRGTRAYDLRGSAGYGLWVDTSSQLTVSHVLAYDLGVPPASSTSAAVSLDAVDATVIRHLTAAFDAANNVVGVQVRGGDVTVTHSIISGAAACVSTAASAKTTVEYSDLYDCGDPASGATLGDGVLTKDPLFADLDYRLDPMSPCIDAGQPEATGCFEPSPNGSALNLGYYGGTAEAAGGLGDCACPP